VASPVEEGNFRKHGGYDPEQDELLVLKT